MREHIGRWPLVLKLWGAFAALTLCIFTLLALLLPWTLKGFFTEQLYDILIDTQSGLQVEHTTASAVRIIKPVHILSSDQSLGAPGDSLTLSAGGELKPGTPEHPEKVTASMSSLIAAPTGGPAIQHLMISGESSSPGTISTSSTTIGKPFIQAMEQDAFAQSVTLQKYSKMIDNRSIFYVIRKEQSAGAASYMVSYAWGNYRNDLVMTMFIRLMLLMVGLILISWLPCLIIARYFTRPLIQMEAHVGKLAERNWHEPLETGRKDEMGRLAKAIERMRQRLVRQDRAQQFFLQHTSHELKTPVMVILSYAQSIHDGVFPKGNLKASVDVIMKEGERLDKRIRDLLLLNKLNYLSSVDKPFKSFYLNEMIEDTIERLRYRRPDIQWEMNLEPEIWMTGDPDQWKIVLENMFDNQLRYAQTVIGIDAQAGPSLKIRNDGPPLEEGIAEHLFEPFRSGGNGQFGLGLAIVKQIAEHHGMRIRVDNESSGAAFYIEPASRPTTEAG